jgi:hypothetical protein
MELVVPTRKRLSSGRWAANSSLPESEIDSQGGDVVDTKNLDQEHLLETYHMLIGQLQFEGNLIWTRHQVFIILNSAIFAGLSLSNRPGTSDVDIRIVYAASLFGIVLCILWFLTAIRSEVYYRYWITQARDVEGQMNASIPILHNLHLAHRGEAVEIGNDVFVFRRIERFASISRISRLVAIAFFVIWVGLAAAFSG